MKKTIRLRTATANDCALLRRWDDEPHIIACDPNDDWHWETELGRIVDWREQYIAMLADQPIGYLEIIDPDIEPEHYWGDCGPNLKAIDIWIGEPDCLNQGYGTQMMTLAIEQCFIDPKTEAILIDPLISNVDAIRFYQRLGFQFLENRWFNQDHCAVHRLERSVWQAQLLVDSANI